MIMDPTRSVASGATAGAKTSPAVTPTESNVRQLEHSVAPGSLLSARKPVGYGLPCAKCHLYYAADLDTCPSCNARERVLPVLPKTPKMQASAEPEIDAAALEQEREEFLRQFKSQLLAAHVETTTAAAPTCNFADNHPGDPEVAEVCKPCYEKLQERLDVCEAALHMDMKEAAQIIYDAVWADPSDPSKTYRNAASAILTELRRRAGITSLLGPFQALTH
jgi:hypothetical protein